MANRSYLYAYQQGATPEHRDLSEWKTNVPLLHLLLVGANATPVRSVIWGVEEKIALRGDGAAGRDLFERFLAWLAPQMGEHAEEFERSRAQALALLGRREDDTFHLELGEVLELGGYELEEMEGETLYYARQAESVVAEVERLMAQPGTTTADTSDWLLRDATNMNESLGLYFPGILFLHLG